MTDRIWGGPKRNQGEVIYTPSETPLPNINQFTDPGFTEPFYQLAQKNMEVESKDSMLEAVKRSHLSWRCKNAWFSVINTYYDRNVMLSDLTGKNVKHGWASDEQVQIAFWRAKIDIMGVIRCNSYKSDRLNPEFTTVEQLIMSQIRFILKRTNGPDRERMASGRIQIHYNSNQKVGNGDKKI